MFTALCHDGFIVLDIIKYIACDNTQLPVIDKRVQLKTHQRVHHASVYPNGLPRSQHRVNDNKQSISGEAAVQSE